MRKILTSRKGGPEVLKIEETPDLHPALGEVRISVKATGLKFADIMIRMNAYKIRTENPYPFGGYSYRILQR